MVPAFCLLYLFDGDDQSERAGVLGFVTTTGAVRFAVLF
jgi:hypothetical protein